MIIPKLFEYNEYGGDNNDGVCCSTICSVKLLLSFRILDDNDGRDDADGANANENAAVDALVILMMVLMTMITLIMVPTTMIVVEQI